MTGLALERALSAAAVEEGHIVAATRQQPAHGGAPHELRAADDQDARQAELSVRDGDQRVERRHLERGAEYEQAVGPDDRWTVTLQRNSSVDHGTFTE